MNNLAPCHCPGLCIIPPYMVESIKLRGDKQQKKMAVSLEKMAVRFRRDRELAIQSIVGQPAIAAVAAIVDGTKPDRVVFDAENKADLPGTLARSDTTGASSDKDVNRAFISAGDVFKFLKDVFGRNSIDDNGMQLVSSVHFRQLHNNAYWNGSQMIYGDGDGAIFTPFVRSLSVVGHEFSHGVVQYSGGLIYQDQSGALNESIADVFGVMTEQYKKKQTVTEASWLVGEEIFTPDVDGDALRSLKAPGEAYSDTVIGSDPQPYHMDFFVNTAGDAGGVHINSGIPNHAFYLLAQYLGGSSWEKTGHIWYEALKSISNPHATFIDWSLATLESSDGLYGRGSMESKFVRRAWKLVGIQI